MIPQLIEEIEIENYNFWLASTGRIGITFSCALIDLSDKLPYVTERIINNILSFMPDDIFVRYHLRSNIISSDGFNHARRSHIADLGQAEKIVYLSFEKKTTVFKNLKSDAFYKQAKDLLEQIPLDDLKSLGMNPVNLSLDEVNDLNPEREHHISYSNGGIDTGIEHIGVLKLLKLGKYSLSYESFTGALDSLPTPYEVVSQIKKIPQQKTELRMSHIAKRESSPQNATDAQKSYESEDALRKVELDGESHFSLELHILFRRNSESESRQSMKEAVKVLSQIGEFKIETKIGAMPSYLSTLVGANFHFSDAYSTITEEHQKVPCYLPIFTRGCAFDKEPSDLSALAFHRLDYSIDYLSLFNREYKNYCAVVVGQAGSGKSVFLNRLIYSLTHNPKSRIIIVDVRGSHTRLVDELGGNISNIDISNPSGINVFKYLKNGPSEYAINIVSAFVAELMLEEDERKISEEEMFDLSSAIKEYAEIDDSEFTLHDFIDFLPAEFPRVKLLKRYSKLGLYKHLFYTKKNENTLSRIQYYNFESIDLASNRSAARAIMAAIMADFNFQLQDKDPSEELIFLSDETPFFIEQCFRSFKLLNKNVRKLYGSLVLTVQVSTDLIVDGDTSLIDNSELKVLLSYDTTKEAFQSRFQISDDEAKTMWEIKPVKGKYSQFLIKDSVSSKVGHLILAPYEYWQSTTESYDLAKIQELSRILPTVDQSKLMTLLSSELR